MMASTRFNFLLRRALPIFGLRPIVTRHQSRIFCSVQDRHILFPAPGQRSQVSNSLTVKRYKKKKAQDSVEDDEDEDDEDNLAEENPMLTDDLLGPGNDGCEKVVIDVATLRLDGFSKAAFNTTRAKIEELFYKGDIYVNGQRPGKKSQDLAQGDEIDMVKQINPDEPTMVDIKRVQIVELPDKTTQQGRMRIKINRWRDLTIRAHGKGDN